MIRHSLRFVIALLSPTLLLSPAEPAAVPAPAPTVERLARDIERARRAGDFAHALAMAEQVLALRESTDGTAVWALRDARVLVADLTDILDLDPAARREIVRADSLGAVATFALQTGQVDSAEKTFTRQLEIRRRILGANRRDTARSLAWLSACRQARGDFAGAIPLFREALDVSRRLLGVAHPDVATNLLNLSSALESQGRPEEASRCSREALALCLELYGDEHPDTAWAMNNLGSVRLMLGDFLSAEPLFRRALAVMRTLHGDTYHELGGLWNNLGQIHMHHGNYGQADVCLRQALAVYEANFGPRHPEAASILTNLGGALQHQGRMEEAETAHRRALTLKRELFGDAHPLTAFSLVTLGNLLLASGRDARADTLFAEALVTQRAMLGQAHPEIAQTLNSRANVRAQRGDLDAAEALYREALAMMRGLVAVPHPDIVRLLVNLGRVQRRQGRDRDAEDTFAEAARIFDQARLRAGYGLDRSTFLAAPHLELAAARLAQGRGAAAWDPLGRAQGRFLADQLLDDETDELTSAERARRESLLTALANLERQEEALVRVPREHRDAGFAARIAELQVRILDAEANLGAFREESTRAHPAGEGPRFNLEEVQSTLDAGDAVVGWLDVPFDPTRCDSWGYVIRKTGPVVWRFLGPEADVDPWALGRDLIDGILAAGFPGDWDETPARAVWQARFGPLVDALGGVRRLVVIPSGPMLGVPVEALVDPQGTLLGDLYTIHYSPSWNIHTGLAIRPRPKTRPGRDRILLVGDPPFCAAQAEAMRDDPARRPAGPVPRPPLATALLRDAIAGDTAALGGLPRLPGSRWEIDRIAASHPGATILLGRQASEQALIGLAETGALERFGTVHLATHALVDDERPLRSALVLSQVDLPDPLETIAADRRLYDGLLTCREIVREWRLAADLVVLSACETGLGRRVGAEGYIGFSYAFLQAGGHALLVSLWKVDDEATALLMGRFHEIRTADPGESTARALREAKAWLRDYVDDGGNRPFGNPVYWSPFILIGNPD